MIHETQGSVVLEVLWQIDCRPHIPLMTRARSIGQVWSWVQAFGIPPYVHLQIAVGTDQSPLGNDFPICNELNAVRASAHLVCGYEGNDDVGRCRAPFEKRCSWLRRSKIGIIVIERSYVCRERVGRLDAIPQLIG